MIDNVFRARVVGHSSDFILVAMTIYDDINSLDIPNYLRLNYFSQL